MNVCRVVKDGETVGIFPSKYAAGRFLKIPEQNIRSIEKKSIWGDYVLEVIYDEELIETIKKDLHKKETIDYLRRHLDEFGNTVLNISEVNNMRIYIQEFKKENKKIKWRIVKDIGCMYYGMRVPDNYIYVEYEKKNKK